jgi:hypothetical protein
MSEALEITSFRLVPNCTIPQFVAANGDINAWLNRQPGFQSRRITALDDGSIMDVLVWASAAQGEDAASRIIGETSQSAVHRLIDHATVVWRIAEVRQYTARS